MKLSLSILPIIVCVFVSVNVFVHGRCRKRRIKYIQQSQPVLPPPPPPSGFSYQSFDDDFSGREAFSQNNNGRVTSANPANSQHPNLSCLLFADDGCNVSCSLMCDINGCESDGFCSQKFYCVCNEVYTVQNRPITADQFKKLSFDDLWNYKFKNTNNMPNPKNRIFQNDEFYRFAMPLLQNPHKSGRDIKEALMSKYPKLSSVKNLQPREHGIKASLFTGDNSGEEKLYQYIQNMMNTIQDSLYDRLSHTRYMRRIINLIKNINNKEDLSYVLRQIRQTGNERLFERVRRYLMKRGYYFDSDLRPISKKACCCAKKKAKGKCQNKCKPKTFFYDWTEDEEGIIETALIKELIGSNNVEGKYPSTTAIDDQPMPEIDYTTTPADDYVPSVIQDVTNAQPKFETDVKILPEDVTKFHENSLVPPNDTQYIINSKGPDYSSVTSQQPKIFLDQSEYPEYGTFFNGANNNYILKKPNSNVPPKQYINYETQQILDYEYFTTPETIYIEKYVQPNNEAPHNFNIPAKPLPTPQYSDKPSSPTTTLSPNQANPSGVQTIYQNPDQQVITSPQNLINNSKPTITPQNLQTPPQPIIPPSITTSQILEESPQTTIMQPQITKVSNDSPIITQNIKKLPQVLENPQKLLVSQDFGDLTPTITTSPQKLENAVQAISIPSTLPKPQPIASPSQNLLQQFIVEKPTPEIIDTSPYLNKLPNSKDLKTYDIPDTTPSVESLFVKHTQSPDKIGAINNPESYTKYLLGNKSSTSLPPSVHTNLPESYTQSQSINVSIPPLYESQTQSDIFTEPSFSTSPHQPNPSQPETSASYSYYSNSNNNFDSPPIIPPSSNTFSDIQTQSSTIPSPSIMQKPKDKLYYQVLMDENGNIIKSANYKYPGQPQYIQDIPQMPSTPLHQYITTNQVDQVPFDKFDKHTILNAAKAKPGDSMVIDYDMETANDIPIFDIPSDIDMASGTFEISPDAFGNHIVNQDEPNRDGSKTLPISYNNEHSYEILGNSQMNNGPGSGIVLPNGDLQSTFGIDRSNINNIPSNSGMIIPGKQSPVFNSPHPFEIDRNNYQIQINNGIPLNYEGDVTVDNKWPAYSTNNGGNSPDHLDNIIHDDNVSIIYNNPGAPSNDVGNNKWSAYSINDGVIPTNDLNSMIHDDDISIIHNSSGPLSNDNLKVYHSLNSDDGGVDIDIFDRSDDAHRTSPGRTSPYSSIKSNNISSGKGHQPFSNMNSSENWISINIADASDDDGIAHRFKTQSSPNSIMKTSSQKSTKATISNAMPVKITQSINNNTSMEAEDISAASEFPEDPEDDLLNF